MNERTKEAKRTGPEAAEKLRALFTEWSREEAGRAREGEPSWEEVREALNEGRPEDGKPFPG
jgi:hypothetical protein